MSLNSITKAYFLSKHSYIFSNVEPPPSQRLQKKTPAESQEVAFPPTSVAQRIYEITEVMAKIFGWSLKGVDQAQQKKTPAESKKIAPPPTTAARRVYEITELMVEIIALSLKGMDQAQTVKRLVELKKSDSLTRNIINRLLTTSEECGIAAQHAWSRESVQRFIKKKGFFDQPCVLRNNDPLYTDLVNNIKKILNPIDRLSATLQSSSIKHLSWNVFIPNNHKEDPIILNACVHSKYNIKVIFYALLAATKHQKSIKSLDIKILNSGIHIPSIELIKQLALAIQYPFIKIRELASGEIEEYIRPGKITLSLKNNGNFLPSHMKELGEALYGNNSQLIIEDNPTVEKCIANLAEGLQYTSISMLSLNKVASGNTWFLDLEDRLPPTLRTLSLESNDISNEGVRNLNRILTPNIKNINLSNNLITDLHEENKEYNNGILDVIFDLIKNNGIRILFLSKNNFKRNAFDYFLERILETEIIILNLEKSEEAIYCNDGGIRRVKGPTYREEHKKNKSEEYAKIVSSTKGSHLKHSFLDDIKLNYLA